MRNLLSGLLLFLITLVCASCGDGEDELWINSDGSALMVNKHKLGDLLSIISKSELLEIAADSSLGDFGKLFASGKFDTILNFEDIARDEMLEKGEPYSRDIFFEKVLEGSGSKVEGKEELILGITEALLDMEIGIQFDYEAGILNFSMILPIDNINNPTKLDFSEIGDLADDKVKNEFFDPSMLGSGSDNSYIFTKNQLIVKVAHKDTVESFDEIMAKSMMSNLGEDSNEETDKKMIIHLPGKVKSVNQPSATYHRNTVTYIVKEKDLRDSSTNLDLIIKFKPKKKLKIQIPISRNDILIP